MKFKNKLKKQKSKILTFKKKHWCQKFVPYNNEAQPHTT